MQPRNMSVAVAAVLTLLLVWNVYRMEIASRPGGTGTDPAITVIQTATQPSWPKPKP
jgi:hypothetical protein